LRASSPPRGSFSSSAMPRAETGGGVSAVRSIGKASAATWEGDALHRARGCLSASGVFRSMYLSGVIVGFFGSLERCGLYAQPEIIYLQVLLYIPYIVLVFFFQHRVLTSPAVVPILLVLLRLDSASRVMSKMERRDSVVEASSSKKEDPAPPLVAPSSRGVRRNRRRVRRRGRRRPIPPRRG
jgi:hypothetical protein